MQSATRILKLQTGQSEHNVPVTVSAPNSSPGGGWSCPYTIAWPEGTRRGEGWGIDAIQAIQMTLQMIGTDLYASTHHAAGQLVWEKRGDGYGFPVPRNIRDLLVGADKEDGGA